MRDALLTGSGVAIYLLGYFPMARWLYIAYDDEDPGNTTNELWAAFCALLWPLVLVWYAFEVTIFRETPRQRKVRLDAEMRKVRDDAQKYGLPMPTVEVRPAPSTRTRLTEEVGCAECVDAAFAACAPRPHICQKYGVGLGE